MPYAISLNWFGNKILCLLDISAYIVNNPTFGLAVKVLAIFWKNFVCTWGNFFWFSEHFIKNLLRNYSEVIKEKSLHRGAQNFP